MSKSTEALEGVFNPDISIRDVVAKIHSVLETRYTTLDSAEQLLARMDTDRNEIKQLILDISNVMAQVHNGTITKTDAVEEVRPLVKQLKSECIALKLVEDLSPDDDITETELQMLNEAITQIHAAVEDHIERLKNNEGSDGEGRAATIADGAQTTASESLYNAMMSGDTLACESLMRSDNMSSTSIMSDMLAMEGDEGNQGNQGAAPAGGDQKEKKKFGEGMKKRIDMVIDKLRELVQKILTWIRRRVQQLRSAPVQVTSGGQAYIAAAKAASTKSIAAANAVYAAVLQAAKAAKDGQSIDSTAIDNAAAVANEAKELVAKANEAKTAAKITVKNVPLAVFDSAQGALKKIDDVLGKLRNLPNYNGEQANAQIRATKPLRTLISALQNMIGASSEESYGSNETAAKDRAHAASIRSENKADKAAGMGKFDPENKKKDDKKAGKNETGASESYDAIAMARAAAAEGNLEGVVESLLLAMSAQPVEEETPADESFDYEGELSEMESSLECALLEADLLD